MENKLICIPSAGGSAELFREMIQSTDDSISCVPLDYAGHGKRHSLPYYDNWDELLEDTASLINETVEYGDRYVLLGYSMGAMVLYELLARKLLMHEPEHLVICSHEEPSTKWFEKNVSELSEGDLVEMMRERGGIDRVDNTILKNRIFRKLYLEPMKKDYELISAYRKTKCDKIDIPYTVLYSAEDIPEERIRSWDDIFKTEGRYLEFSGKHFFIKKHTAEVAEVINKLFDI